MDKYGRSRTITDPYQTWDYKARYSDRHGSEVTVIHNDGQELSMVVRGITFKGWMFDDFGPDGVPPTQVMSTFTLQLGCLCACSIDCQIPIFVSTGDENVDGALQLNLEIGPPASHGGVEFLNAKLSLALETEMYATSGVSGFMENELLELQKQLPPGVFVRTCLNCAFSDYSPYGHGLFGGLACFRSCKPEYGLVKSKQDLLQIWDQQAGLVQETFLCPDFERRIPRTGYRG